MKQLSGKMVIAPELLGSDAEPFLMKTLATEVKKLYEQAVGLKVKRVIVEITYECDEMPLALHASNGHQQGGA